MANFMDFSSDKVDIFFILLDASGSMDSETDKVEEGLKMYQKSFKNFPEVNSIAVSVSSFASGFYPSEFKQVKDISTSYSTGGCTALNYAIHCGAEYLQEYLQKITEAKGIVPRATFIVFSDGQPYEDRMSATAGRKAIERLNLAGITTVFVAFGDSITAKFGEKMGFVSTIDVTNRRELVNFLGVELSKSCKEQSKSMKSLGANFFSQAANKSSSANYSQATKQVLEDTGWIDDI